MADETQQAGTPGSQGEGGTASAAGTPPSGSDGGTNGGLTADERAELERVRAAQQQLLGQKSKWEDDQRELQALREREAQRAYTPPTGYAAPNPLQQALQTVAETQPEVAQLWAAQAQATQQEVEALRAENRYQLALAAVPDADRAEVDRIARSMRIWPSLAHNQVYADRARKREQELSDRERKVREQEDRLKRNVVRTTAEPAFSAPSAEEITDTEYDRIIANASKGDRDARKKLNDVEDGKLRVRYG